MSECPNHSSVIKRLPIFILSRSVVIDASSNLGSPVQGRSSNARAEKMRLRYEFFVSGYVVMPEHVHLLLGEPKKGPLAKALQALKLTVAVQRIERPFWQARYYDFNVFTDRKRVEKLKYIHRNPVTRGLVTEPEDWAWSSFRHYSSGERGIVEIESPWTAMARDRASNSHISEARCGAPSC